MNLADVAVKAGVSTATVSRVLNNVGAVKAATRAKVLKAVEQLRYYPNMHARALAQSSSRTIGLVVSNLENPFFVDIYRTVEMEAHRHGYEVLIANTGYDPERLRASVKLMLGRRPAGLALVVSEIDQATLEELAERKIRTVTYDVGVPRPKMASIKTNYRVGMRRVAEYLYSLGHRRFAFIGHHTSLGPLSDRKQVFLEVMDRYGSEVEYTTVADEDGFEGGRHAVRALLESGFRQTAIVCVNDFMAAGVLRELREAGLRVAADVSVTGFDNIALSEMVYPALTTVHVPRVRIGLRIFESLTAQEANGGEIVIEPELVVRDSTGPAARAAALPGSRQA